MLLTDIVTAAAYQFALAFALQVQVHAQIHSRRRNFIASSGRCRELHKPGVSWLRCRVRDLSTSC